MNSTKNEFIRRRSELTKTIKEGVLLLAANQVLPRNYAGNVLPFRQDSSFLYYTGIDRPDLLLLIDCQSGDVFLAGNDLTVEGAVWSGPQPTLLELAEKAGIEHILSPSKLKNVLNDYKQKKHTIHYLPPYTAQKILLFSGLLDCQYDEVVPGASAQLIDAVIAQRSVKSEAEISEIESALDQVTGPMHELAMKMAVEGRYEHEIVAEMYRLAKEKDLEFAYPVICSVRGEVLHNESHKNRLQNGQLLLIDAGVESQNHYASDITRTTPVGGKFNSQQKEIYEIVLSSQLKAIENLQPGIPYRDIHFEAARNMTDGLKLLGLMKGDTQDAVNAGAHALFFPHGLGHMLGLDVHDMEDLGEDRVGYDESVTRNPQFGTAYLRMAKKLKPGYVLTVEPGIYFIPALIGQWQGQRKLDQFINYGMLEKYRNFGGIRIEDNVVITGTGSRVLGKPIKKTVSEIETLS